MSDAENGQIEESCSPEANDPVCSWCEPVNKSRNHTICPAHEAEMERQIETLAATSREGTGRGER